MCTECSRPSIPTSGLKYKRTVLIFLFYALLLIDFSASVIRCYSDNDCASNHCCVGYYHQNQAATRCKLKLPVDSNCQGFALKKKYIALPNGRGIFDRCGCQHEFTCRKIKRKNWKKKKSKWSRAKKKMKTPYKYRCK